VSTGLAIYEVDDGVARLTMDRSEAANALNERLRQSLREGFERFAADPSAAALVLTGAGRSFSAGGDLREMADLALEVPAVDFVPQPGRTVKVDKPIIAAVNGAAYGGGFLLAQTCDLCIAADNARFAISEAKWGRGAPWAAPLPWLVPPRIALELLLTGEPLSAERALMAGLVNRVVPAAELLVEADRLARTVAANAPLSVRAAKAMVYASAGRSRQDAWDEGERLFRAAYLSRDAQEGPRAFSEGRPPRWEGR
jgi:enoyl-CoA hydratase/carnithine racemase